LFLLTVVDFRGLSFYSDFGIGCFVRLNPMAHRWVATDGQWIPATVSSQCVESLKGQKFRRWQP
jgi:hypothetical protein